MTRILSNRRSACSTSVWGARVIPDGSRPIALLVFGIPVGFDFSSTSVIFTRSGRPGFRFWLLGRLSERTETTVGLEGLELEPAVSNRLLGCPEWKAGSGMNCKEQDQV